MVRRGLLAVALATLCAASAAPSVTGRSGGASGAAQQGGEQIEFLRAERHLLRAELGEVLGLAQERMAVLEGQQAERRGKPALTARDWRIVFVLGFTGYYLASFLDFAGLQYITASLERLILYLNPTLVLLLGPAQIVRGATILVQ